MENTVHDLILDDLDRMARRVEYMRENYGNPESPVARTLGNAVTSLRAAGMVTQNEALLDHRERA